jgi:hypothetical protein
MVEDLTVSPDGTKAAAVAKEGEKWTIMTDETLWPEWYEMIWSPVFSPDSRHLAVKVEKPGKRYTIVVNGKPYKDVFSHCWTPVFSPDSQSVLIRGVQGGTYKRIVAKVNEF